MLGVYRKEYLVRTFLVTAMVWGFALPVVHLVCGMGIEQESVLCDDHAVTEGQHASGTHAVRAGAGHAVYADDVAVKDPTVSIEAPHVRIQCCLVDANAADRRAPLPSLTQMPDLAVSHTDVTTSDALPDMRAADLVVADDASPPISFRLLFSVFLI